MRIYTLIKKICDKVKSISTSITSVPVTLTVYSNRVTDVSYYARYYPFSGMVFCRIYGVLDFEPGTGDDYWIFRVSDTYAPGARYALSTYSASRNYRANIRSDGYVAIRKDSTAQTMNGYAVYISGFWYVG